MAFSFDQFYKSNRRILIWLVLLGLLWLMRDFFGVVFLTFVIAFFAAPSSAFVHQRLRMPPWLALTTVYALLLLALGSFVRFVTPSVISEAGRLANNMDSVEDRIIEANRAFAARYPALQQPLMGILRGWLDEDGRVALQREVEGRARTLELDPSILLQRGTLETLPEEQQASAAALVAFEEERLLDHLIRSQGRIVQEYTPEAINLLYGGLVTTALALLFSFLILADRTRLTRLVEALERSHLKDFYDEAARPVARLASVVGRGLQAQAMIALANTVLTIVGLLLLGIPSVTVLALIVFVCSFVPVLGVFISTVPIVLVALNTSGIGLALGSIAMIVGVHVIEAYLLNPLIYGQHLKLNPVLSLLILFVAYRSQTADVALDRLRPTLQRRGITPARATSLIRYTGHVSPE